MKALCSNGAIKWDDTTTGLPDKALAGSVPKAGEKAEFLGFPSAA
jgi:hypothetical protein